MVNRGTCLLGLPVGIFLTVAARGGVWRFGYEGKDAVHFLFLGCNLELVHTLHQVIDFLIRLSNHFN